MNFTYVGSPVFTVLSILSRNAAAIEIRGIDRKVAVTVHLRLPISTFRFPFQSH